MSDVYDPMWDDVTGRYFDMDGKPISMRNWCALFEDHSRRRLAFDTVGEAEISTVWLGLNHNFLEGPPLIFETMVFGGPMNQEMQRYSTQAEALDGHKAMVDKVRALKQ